MGKISTTGGTKYSKMDQVKFFKGCLPQISFGSFLNTLSQMSDWVLNISLGLTLFLRHYKVGEKMDLVFWPFKRIYKSLGKIDWILTIQKTLSKLKSRFSIQCKICSYSRNYNISLNKKRNSVIKILSVTKQMIKIKTLKHSMNCVQNL